VDFLPCKAKIRRHPDGWQGFLTQSGRKIRRQDMRGGDFKQALRDGSGTDTPQLARLAADPEIISGGYEDE
jgi:hypothetical protein